MQARLPLSDQQRHFVDTAKAFVYYPYLKKARSAPAPYVLGTVDLKPRSGRCAAVGRRRGALLARAEI